MKNRLRTTLLVRCGALLALTLLAAPLARATVLVELAGGYLKNSSGTAIASGSGLLLLVASTSDSSFSLVTTASSLTVGSLLNANTDDYVLSGVSISGDGYMNGNSEAGEFRQVITLSLDSTITEGAALQLYWFPDLSTSGTSATVGTAYGIYRSIATTGSTDADGSDAWFLPADGTSGWTLLFLTSDTGSLVNTGSSSLSSGTAALSVAAIPEPATWSLLTLGLAAALAGRRRRKHS